LAGSLREAGKKETRCRGVLMGPKHENGKNRRKTEKTKRQDILSRARPAKNSGNPLGRNWAKGTFLKLRRGEKTDEVTETSLKNRIKKEQTLKERLGPASKKMESTGRKAQEPPDNG